MNNDAKPLAKGSGTTNPTPQSLVTDKAKPPILVTYRLFAADTTEVLSGKARKKQGKTLRKFPFVLGLVEGGALAPLTDGIVGVPDAKTLAGRLKNGVFIELTAEEKSQRKRLTEQAKDKKRSAEERNKSKQELATLMSGADDVEVHVIKVPKLLQAGKTVGICFGVDVKSKFRKYPLGQVTAGDNDIVVDVFETYGPHALNDKATKVSTLNLGTAEAPKPTDFYSAKLTGDIWMRSTHPFTAADVDALPKDTASDTARTALKRIYAGEFDTSSEGFSIDVASHEAGHKDRKLTKLLWIAAENGNCISNITGLVVKNEVPRRIHPAAYAAVARAAHEAGVDTVKFTSSWRPMLGSPAHRLGLGLDIKWLVEGKSAYQMNRDSLLTGKVADADKNGVVDGETITVEEQEAFNAWKKAQAELATAKAAKEAADAEVALKQAALNKAAGKGDNETITVATEGLENAKKAAEDATDVLKESTKAEKAKKAAWTKQLEQHEPEALGRYRRYVMQQPCITQVIDPWYTDFNKADKQAPQPNLQITGDEKLHNNHMHLTIKDPEFAK